MVARALIVIAALGCNSSPPPAPSPAPAAPTAPGDAAPTAPEVVAAQLPPTPKPSKALRDALSLDGPGSPTAVDPRETVRLVAHAPNEIRVYHIASGALTLEARTPVADFQTVRGWAWANANVLVVLLGEGVGKSDYKLVVLRDGAFKPLAAPADKLFVPTLPASGHDADRLFATQSGEVWWHHCGVMEETEPHRCTRHVSVRVFPEATQASRPPAERAPITELAPPPPCPNKNLAKAEWLSLTPPVARLGIGDDARYVVACKQVEEPNADGVVRGPRGFWSSLDPAENVESKHGTATLVLWHTFTVGVLADVEALGFSP